MFKSINEERKTYSNLVVENIRDLILAGRLKPGEKLPGERELAEKMNVSRPTIREAFKILSAMGYVKIKHGNGVFVSEQSERFKSLASFLFIQTDTIQELFEVRKTLETESAARAASRGTKEYLKQIHKKTVDVYNKVIKGEFKDRKVREDFLFESDQEFHLMIAEAAGNDVVVGIMHNLLDLLNQSRMQSMKIPGRVEQSLKEHILIAEALVSRDSEASQKNMYQHLFSVEQDLIQELKERSKDSSLRGKVGIKNEFTK